MTDNNEPSEQAEDLSRSMTLLMKCLVPSIIGFVLFYTYSLSQTLSGQVVSIADGDTITMLDSSKKQVKIRLYGIDTPEKGQPFGKAAKKAHSQLGL